MGQRLAKRVLLIGWDAADWRLIRPLMDQGHMPTLKSLVQRGVSGRIRTLRPVLSPMLWNTVATGKHADRHGILGFAEPRPDGQGIRPASSTSRTCRALWNILDDEGLRSIVVNWFASHPAEHVNGAIVTDRYAVRPLLAHANAPAGDATSRGVFHPASLAERLEPMLVDPARLGPEAILPFIPRAAEIDQASDDRIARLARLIAKTSSVHAAACRLIAEEEWDLAAVYYDAIDHFGHTFMPYHPPAVEGVSERDAELYGNCVTACYRFHDMMLDAMLSYAGDYTTVLLISDHGFHHDDKRPGPDGYHDPVGWHHPFGVLAAAGPGVRVGGQHHGATLLDVTPTILTLLGLPVGADMDGKPWVEILDPPTRPTQIITWEQTPSAGAASTADEAAPEDPAAAAELLRQLADLGYIDPPGESAIAEAEKTAREQTLNLALCLSYSGTPRTPNAIPLFQSLIETASDAEADRLRFELASCLMRLGRPDECAAVLDQIDRIDEHPMGCFLRAEILIARDEPETALAVLDRARNTIGVNRGHLNALIGSAYLRLDRAREAEAAFRDALEIDPDIAGAHEGLSRVALEREAWQDAADHALLALGLIQHMPAAHQNLGLALAGLGRTEDAILSLKTALSISPGLTAARSALETLLRESGRAREAEDVRLGTLGVTTPPIEPRASRTPRTDQASDDDDRPTIVVSGLPRSGTSLMMQLLNEAGVPAVTDGHRAADEDNPRGYYELEAVKHTASDASWLDRAGGHAVKVIAPLLESLPRDRRYLVIYMTREPGEIIASQAKMVERRGGEGARLDRAALKAQFEAQRRRAEQLLSNEPCFRSMSVSYNQLLDDPIPTAEQVLRFIGNDADADRVARVVTPTLHRNRAAETP